mmetsp:Transcript_66389/g.147520  ORF Transcript_66389/g.147520 Transcript_66389/m.147520 type:complete len:322 (+) Transcript_66389:70-1035(+)
MSKKRGPEGDADELAETRRKARRINYYLDLVPARYYLGTESAQAKGGKWAHLDPKLVKSTTQLIAEAASAEDKPSATSSKKKKKRDRRSLSQSPEPSGPNSRAELKAKLERRIEELREERRRKQSEADKAKAAEIRAAREKAGTTAPNGVKAHQKTEGRARQKSADADEEQPEVGRLSFEAEASNLPFEANVGQRGKKVKKLQAELRKQEADAAKLRAAESRGEGDELRKELAYEKALQRARGEKVHDDASKLRKVQKTLEMKKKKGQDRWNAKVESDKQKAEEKQAQRKENLHNRGTKNKNKMQRRMGFEGRRTSFLNSE